MYSPIKSIKITNHYCLILPKLKIPPLFFLRMSNFPETLRITELIKAITGKLLTIQCYNKSKAGKNNETDELDDNPLKLYFFKEYQWAKMDAVYIVSNN